MTDWTGNAKSVFVCNGASNHTEEERQQDDYYATDPIAIHKLCEVEKFSDKVFEPAAGEGHMVNALKENGYEVFASDIVDRRGGGILLLTSLIMNIHIATLLLIRHISMPKSL